VADTPDHTDTPDHRIHTALGRRDFFKGAALGAAGLVVIGPGAADATAGVTNPAGSLPMGGLPTGPLSPPLPVVPLPGIGDDAGYAISLPGASLPGADTQADRAVADAALANGARANETSTNGANTAFAQASGAQAAPGTPAMVPTSDVMVDILKKIGFDYAVINPGSTFQGLHESFVNYGGNTAPELLTCLHEESALAMAHGYAKASGRPMLAMVHGTVGLLHSSMALFQAWADRVPVFMIVAHHRNPSGVINRPHSAQDMGAIVRHFVKFDDEATTLERFAESAMRAYRIAMTPPMGPVLLTVSAELQESMVARGSLRIPELAMPAPPQGDANSVREAARLLVGAQTPLIQIAKMGRTPKAWDLLIELAEALQAPVDAGGYASWQKFPSWHPLYGNGGRTYTPDVTLGLEVNDMSAQTRAARASGRKVISICAEYLYQGSNIHDFGRYADVDLAIAADAEATLPSLIEEIRRLITPERKSAFQARGVRLAATHKEGQLAALQEARHGWDASPVSVPRLVAELAEQVKNDDWAIVSGHQFTGDWQRKLLNHDKSYRYNGDCGGFGIGYDTPASVGGALAHRRQGRLSIGIVGDGDLNFGPGVLWTAVHHKIPLLLIVHNNRAYHAEVMIIQRMSGVRGRGAGRSHIGNVISDPNINYAEMAKAYGMYSEGPIEHPKDLAGAYQRALAKVRAGEPALVDVVSQPR
jgi:acetolactate synthase I/II/III large subunit